MLVNITFLPRGRESIAWECQQVCGLKKGDSIEAFLSNQRVSTSSMKRPKRGTHRAFQNPRDMEKLDRGLYHSPEQLALAPAAPVCGTLSSHMGEPLRDPSEFPFPGLALGHSAREGLGRAWDSRSPPSTQGGPDPCSSFFLSYLD